MRSIPPLQRTLLSSANIYTRSRRFFYSVARRPHGNIAEIFALCTTERNNLLFIHMVNNPIVFTILPKALRNIRILLKAPTTPGVARFSTPWIELTEASCNCIHHFLSNIPIDLEIGVSEWNCLKLHSRLKWHELSALVQNSVIFLAEILTKSYWFSIGTIVSFEKKKF